MDPDFLQQLDNHISNIGIDKVWKKQIGDHLIWFSPLTTTAQSKVNETLADEDLGINAIAETKRITLANAIVGVDKFDLTEYREVGPVFSVPGKKPGEKVKVTLDKYIHTKTSKWGNDWFDLAFQVFADLMETFSEENRKDVRFDNIKDPREELVELEMRVAQIRKDLNMSQLVEEKEPESTEEEAIQEAKEEAAEAGVTLDDFDPFKAVPDTTGAQEEQSPEPEPNPTPLEVPPEPAERILEAPQNPQAVVSVPTPDPARMDSTKKASPIQEAMAHRAQAQRAQVQTNVGGTIDAKNSSFESPINPTPSIATDQVVDEKVQKSTKPVKIDKKTGSQSRNPRFKKPNR